MIASKANAHNANLRSFPRTRKASTTITTMNSVPYVFNLLSMSYDHVASFIEKEKGTDKWFAI
jgi:hypothetical protein